MPKRRFAEVARAFDAVDAPSPIAVPNGTKYHGWEITVCLDYCGKLNVPRGETEIPSQGGISVNRLKRRFLAIILCSDLFLLSGCLESSFKLSDESRLPVWIHLPPKVKRQDVSLTLNYYSNPLGPSAKFILRDKHGTILEEISGEDTPLGNNLSKYPLHDLVVVNGISEIVEHRAMEPVFYISDDPAIRSKLPHGK